MISADVKKQIGRDVTRTFPKVAYFSKNSNGVRVLKRILISYAIHVRPIGYTQGMNFVCATLLYHSTEYVAFHLFNVVMEKYLCEIYSENLVGLITESHKISRAILSDPRTKKIAAKIVFF